MKPKISVLTTIYNGEKFIEETIMNVLNQSFKDFEWIIVDDGSTDKTAEIIEKHEWSDYRIKYFNNGKNQGYFNFHRAINLGLTKCKGKYIARIDADDLMDRHRLQKQFDYLEKHKDVFMIGTSAYVIDDKGRVIDTIKKRHYPSWLYKYRIFKNSFIHSSIMFRNEGLKYPWHNEHFFYFNMIVNGKKIKNIPDILVDYRINPNGMMVKHSDLKDNPYRRFYRR